MILGVDHVALSCADLEDAIVSLVADGFTLGFAEHDLPNDPAKRPFLDAYATTHDIAWLRGARGPAIELTAHGRVVDGTPSYELVIVAPGGEPDGPVGAAIGTAIGTPPARSGTWRHLAAPRWEVDGTDAGVAAIVLRSARPEATASFWKEALGAKQHETGMLRITRPVPAWSLDVVILPGEVVAPGLDVRGGACVAFLVNHIGEELDRLRAAGATDVSDTFRVPVNGRRLEVALARSPGGELIELIDVGRRRRADGLTSSESS